MSDPADRRAETIRALHDQLAAAEAERDQAREKLRLAHAVTTLWERLHNEANRHWREAGNDRDRLRTLLERAVGALEGVAPFLEPDPSARVDELADRFYRATGVMAPGKSVAMEMAMSQPPDDVRRDQYAKWLRQHLSSLHENTSATIAELRSALDDARDQGGTGED